MKKNYIKPNAEVIEFQPKDEILDIGLPGIGDGNIGESVGGGPVDPGLRPEW